MGEADEPPAVGDLLLDDLRRLVADRQVVAVIGAGAAAAATGGAPVASWTGLLEHGVGRCVGLGLGRDDWGERMRDGLRSGDPVELLAVAEQVSTRLGAPAGGEYRRWLRETVGSLKVRYPDVLEALQDLGVPLVTTNYDGLLEVTTGLPAVTWREAARVERVLHGEESGVLHLHGYWNDPESVVLGIRSYEAVLGDAHAQAVLRGLRLTRSLLFVGFGAGLADPNFDSFLRWTREAFAGSEYRQFRLARLNEVAELQPRHPPEERVFVVPYGEHHGDLAPFLRGIGRRLPGPPPGRPSGQGPAAPPREQRLWSLPHARNPDFTGREDLLTRLAEALGAVGEAAVHGLGGVGKTQLAIEYAHRHADDYDVVWWLRAEEPATVAADYAALAGELGLSDASKADQAVAVAAVRRWLERGERRWLLVFDNAEEHDDLAEFLPRRGGHLIVTSRNRSWPRAMRRVEVDVLAPEEAARFLLRWTEQDDQPAALALAEELGYLPLGLAQAGAYVDAVGLSLDDYLARYRAHRAELLRRGKPDAYPFTVATTWELSFRAAAEQAPVAEDLMNLLAFLAPEGIPLHLLAPHAASLPGPLAAAMANPVAIDDAVAALRRYSLVEVVDGRTLSVHRLVQFVARDRLPEEDRRTWATAAVEVVNAAFPGNVQDVETWPTCEQLLPHGLATAEQAEQIGIAISNTGRLLNQVGMYLRGRARFPEARRCLERALALAEAVHGPDDPAVSAVLTNLGNVLLHQGNPDVAQGHLERALTNTEAQLGRDHPSVANVLNSLSDVARAQGHLGDARAWAVRALEIDEAAYGSDHVETAVSRNNLALVLNAQGHLDEAREQYEAALQILDGSYGPNHPLVATVLNNLASVVWGQGRLREAIPLYEQAFASLQSVYGESHPDVAACLNNLGNVQRELGDLPSAHRNLERALAIGTSVHGLDHPTVGNYLNNLGNVLREEGHVDRAREHSERALAILEGAHGPNHPMVAKVLDSLASSMLIQGQVIQAQQYLQRALAITKAIHGSNHPDLVGPLNGLGVVLDELGEFDLARSHLEQAVAIGTATLGPDHPTLGSALVNLAATCQKQGDFAAARDNFEQAFEIFDRQADGRAGLVLNALANLDRTEGMDDAAVEKLQRALALRQARGERYDESVCFFQLAGLSSAAGRLPEALRLLAASYVVDREIGHSDAEARDRPQLQELAARLGLDEARLEQIVAEVEAAYRADRGRGLVAAAFPEIATDERAQPSAQPPGPETPPG